MLGSIGSTLSNIINFFSICVLDWDVEQIKKSGKPQNHEQRFSNWNNSLNKLIKNNKNISIWGVDP